MKLHQILESYLRARVTLISVVSREEERIVAEVEKLSTEKKPRFILSWDIADGFKTIAGYGKLPPKCQSPLNTLQEIEKIDTECVVLLKDFHECLRNQPMISRKLRNLSQEFKYTKKTIILSGVTNKLPDDLIDACVTLTLPLPGCDELNEILDDLLRVPGVKVSLTPKEREHLISASLGLTHNQAQRVFSRAIVRDGSLNSNDIELIIEEKKQILSESGALEFYPAEQTINDVGGLEALKEWLKSRKVAFSVEAMKYGIPAPKGLALIGIPGTGKSLAAKMISSLWKMPLIRLDVGAIFGSLVGESEANIRKALSVTETVAPCLLWIDEIEKAVLLDGNDGGTSKRVFASLLTWMQEKRSQVFIIATANNISELPPELMRRGRFDDIFFLDLPNKEERKEIFRIHIAKRKRNPDNFDLEKLALISDGYVGSEIEQAVIDGMFAAFNDPAGTREITTDDLAKSTASLVPLSKSSAENIEQLRRWLKEGRAKAASFPDHESSGSAKDSTIQLEQY